MKILLTGDTHYGFDFSTDRIIRKAFKNDWPDDNEIDIIVHTGDWISHKQKQFPKILNLFKGKYPTTPIVGVRGNHDFWNSETHGRNPINGSNYDAQHTSMFKDAGAHLLNSEPFIFSKDNQEYIIKLFC